MIVLSKNVLTIKYHVFLFWRNSRFCPQDFQLKLNFHRWATKWLLLLSRFSNSSIWLNLVLHPKLQCGSRITRFLCTRLYLMAHAWTCASFREKKGYFTNQQLSDPILERNRMHLIYASGSSLHIYDRWYKCIFETISQRKRVLEYFIIWPKFLILSKQMNV
jgi:hypothetical protein